jgi:Protein of unknown function (DUF3970)
MIKIRLHGLQQEISEYLKKLHNDQDIKILSESNIYADRGKSEYKRLYLDVEVKKD